MGTKIGLEVATVGTNGPNQSQFSVSWIMNGRNLSSWKQVMQAQLKHRGVWDAVTRQSLSTEEEKAQDREALYILKASIKPA